MEKRRFGKTGTEVTVICLGGCGLGNLTQAEADKAISLAYEDYGVNIIDVAPSYGDAELRLRGVVSNHREDFFLAEKTMERTKEAAWKELEQSLGNLGTDYFDLYQFHAVKNFAELDRILNKGGALKAFEEARESDMIKNIGITGHDNIEVLIQALDRFEFDTILAPVTLASAVEWHPTNDFRPLLEKVREGDIGLQAIKAVMKRRWEGERTHHTWYEPLTDPDLIKRSVHFALSQVGVTTLPLPCDTRLWPDVLEAGESFRHLSDPELEEIVSKASKEELTPLFPEP